MRDGGRGRVENDRGRRKLRDLFGCLLEDGLALGPGGMQKPRGDDGDQD